MLIYRSKMQDLTATIVRGDRMDLLVELTLGSETRTFQLWEFTHFCLGIVEEDRKVTSAYLDSLEQPGT